MRQGGMRSSLKIVTSPTSYPITVADAKAWMRIDDDTDDSLIQANIASATQVAEAYTRRAFITQTLRLTIDRPPSRFNDSGYMDGYHEVAISEINPFPDKIELPRPPLVSISSIKSYGRTGTESTFSASNYYLDAEGNRVALYDGVVWPTDLRDYAALEINYVAGYGDAGAVPSAIRDAIKMYVSAMYESRMCGEMPDACRCLLDPYRIIDRLSFNG